MAKRRRTTEEDIARVIELFPNHTRKEIAALTGLSESTIDRIQGRYHLRKSRAHLHNMGVRAGKASNAARGGKPPVPLTKEIIEKRVASYKETRRKEDIRFRWGLEQKTKIRLRQNSNMFYDQASYLRELGYIVDKPGRVAYYTDKTHRAKLLERIKRGQKSGRMRCFFDFKPKENGSSNEIGGSL